MAESQGSECRGGRKGGEPRYEGGGGERADAGMSGEGERALKGAGWGRGSDEARGMGRGMMKWAGWGRESDEMRGMGERCMEWGERMMRCMEWGRERDGERERDGVFRQLVMIYQH